MLPTLTLLIVEDVQAPRYQDYLVGDSNYDYCLLTAGSVADGLELGNTRAIDVILLDDSLPDGDGLTFLGDLQIQSNSSNPPVVIVLGQSDVTIAVKAIKLGAHDYLAKCDLTPELLQLTIHSAIENARLWQLPHCDNRFRVSIENMLDCFGIYSAVRSPMGQIIDFRFDYLNAAALESNQMTLADIGTNLCELFPATCERDLFEEYCRVVETGAPLVREELIYLDVSGTQQLTRAYSLHVTKLNDGFVASWRDVTARKQAELTLQETNQRITTIWESMTDAYVNLDRDWRIVYTNHTATQVVYQLVGLTPPEFLGKTHWEVFPWSVGNIVEQEYRRAFAEQVPSHFEVLYEPTQTWFEVHVYPSTVGLGIYFRDISDRKRIEIERIQAEEDRDRFFNLSLDLLAIANFEGYLLRLNPAWEQTLGFSEAELMAQPYLDLIHPEDRASTLAAAQGLSAGQVTIRFENRYRCKDGSYRWLSWSAMPYIERDLIYAIGHDITERKQAEAALRESERKFGAIFDQTFELIGILSLDGVLLEVNQSALDSIGAQASEIVGKRFWETRWWDSAQLQQQAKESIDRVISGQLIRYEVQFTSASGDLITTDFSLKPVFDDGGRVTMIIAEARDITERKQAEAALEDRVHELDRVNSLLAESAALLQDRNQELDSFVYVVSHDLKAPLRGISNLSQWIEDDLDGSLDPNGQQQMALLRTRVRRMESTIDGLLDYARLGRMEARIDRVVVTELLAETIDSIAPPPTFAIVIAPDLPTLYTKRLLLFQVFTNLISNGIKHHHRADGVIHVSGRDLGNLYEFAIADDGPGISPEHHHKIFMIFQAVNPQNRSDSTGIGLSIVKKIVDTEGGTIRLESEIGKGTTFYFTWPKQS